MACFEKPELESLMNEWESLMRQGNEYCMHRDWQSAESKYNHALFAAETMDEIYRELRQTNPTLPATLSTLAHLYREWGKYSEARQLYERELAYWQKVFEHGPHPFVASVLEKIGEFFVVHGKFEEAEDYYNQAIKIREHLNGDGEGNLELAHCLDQLAGVKLSQGNFAAAEVSYKGALKIRNRILGVNDLAVAATLHRLAAIHRWQGDIADAKAIDEQAKAIWSKHTKAPAVIHGKP